MFSRRRILVCGSAAIATSACTTFNTETGEKFSCDTVAYNFNTGLVYGSPAFNPAFVNDGGKILKWKSNNQSTSASGNHHDQSTIVVGASHNGEPALPNTKWIKAPDQFLNPGDEFLFSFCFCADNTKISSIPLSQQMKIMELHIKSSHLLHRVFLNQAILYGAASGKEYIYTNDPSHDAYFVDGLNCLHIHLINDDPYPIPVDAAISVSGYASGISCCD